MGLFRWIEELRALWWYVSEGQFGELEVPLPNSIVRQDQDAPNLFVGKLIGDNRLEGKVISFDENNIQMEITKIDDKYFERYMDVGKTYPMFRHEHWTFERGLMLWEVDPASMKRDVSQILLQWEEKIGWTWDLDM